MNARVPGRMSLAFQFVAPGDCFEFDPDCVHDRDYGAHLEFKLRERRAKLVNRQGIVAVHQHMPTPLAHTDYEELDLEIGWRRPLTKHFKDSLLDILVLYGRTLRALEPADYVFHLVSLIADCKRADRSQNGEFYHLGDTGDFGNNTPADAART
jgi:hypothetical protein